MVRRYSTGDCFQQMPNALLVCYCHEPDSQDNSAYHLDLLGKRGFEFVCRSVSDIGMVRIE